MLVIVRTAWGQLSVVFGHHDTKWEKNDGSEPWIIQHFVVWVTNAVKVGMSGHIFM